MFEDLRRPRVLLLRHEARLFEQGQIDVGLHVTLGTRVTVPVPRAAEVAGLVDDADAVHASLAQACAGDEAAEPAADDDHIDLVVQGRAGEARLHIGVIHVAAEVALDLHVLVIGVRTQALVTLEQVLAMQGNGVEIKGGGGRHGGIPMNGGGGRNFVCAVPSISARSGGGNHPDCTLSLWG